MRSTQLFEAGDLVLIAEDLGPCMRHFTSNVDAIVCGSCYDLYGGKADGGSNGHQYQLFIRMNGRHAWYHEHQLTLLMQAQMGLRREWEQEIDEHDRTVGDLDWIFEHGPNVVKRADGATVATLARTIGITNLWGKRGEGITLYLNSRRVMELALPFLLSKDKQGWLRFAKALSKRRS